MVRINNMGDTTFQYVEGPVPLTSSNTNILATSGFVRLYQESQNLIRNNIYGLLEYTITAVKTIFQISVTNINAGVSGLTIGPSLASSVNVLSATTPAGKLSMYGTIQSLLPSLTDGIPTVGWAYPLITRNIENKTNIGLFAVLVGGTTITFLKPFSVGCVPIIVANSVNATPYIVTLYQPTGTASHLGFGAVVSANPSSRNVTYIAFGY